MARPNDLPSRGFAFVLTCAILELLAASSAPLLHAQTMNLSWTDCGASGFQSISSACNTNVGTNVMVVTFTDPTLYNHLSAIEGFLTVTAVGDTLPDWWKLGSGECRANRLISSADFTSYSWCTDFWAGSAATGMSYISHPGGDLSKASLQVAVAADTASTDLLTPGLEQYAFRLLLSNGKTVAGCNGCAVPVCVRLDSLHLYQQGVIVRRIFTPDISRYIGWQVPPCADPPPVITNLSPLGGAWGSTVDIFGQGLLGTTSVTFLGAFLGTGSATFSIISDAQIRATVPSAVTRRAIRVTTPFGSGDSPMEFGIAPVPAVISPICGPPGTRITMIYPVSDDITDIRIGGPGGMPLDPNWVIPVGATTGGIWVQNPWGSATGPTFTVKPLDPVTGSNPAGAEVGTSVQLFGPDFANVSAVKFSSGVSAAFTPGATTITATVPAGAVTGPITIQWTCPNTPGPSTASATSAYSFYVGAAPAVTGIAPTSGPVGAPVDITGTGFVDAASGGVVRFNGVSASYVFHSATSLTATVPADATTGTISVTNPTGTGSSPTPFVVSGVVSVEPMPVSLFFDPPRPNPTSDQVEWSFGLPQGARVNLTMFDLHGARVRSLANGWRDAGFHHVSWNGLTDRGERVRPGIYYGRFEVNAQTMLRKVVLLR